MTELVDVRDFGWVGGATRDESATIQAAINQVLAAPDLTTGVFIPGPCGIGAPVIVGNNSFSGLVIAGAKPTYRNSGKGTALYALNSTGATLVVQGARQTFLRDFTVIGRNLNRAMAVAGGSLGLGALDRLQWLDPAIWPDPTTPLRQYVEDGLYAGIAVKPLSSGVRFTNVHACGFAVGIGIGIHHDPLDGNGDFVDFDGGQLSGNVYNFAVGNSQARCTNLMGVQLDSAYCGVTNAKFGRASGKLHGTWSGCHFGSLVKVAELYTSPGAPALAGCYGEGLYQFGDFAGGGSAANTVTMDGCEWHFGWSPAGNGAIAAKIINGDVRRSFILMNGGAMTTPTVMGSTANIVFRETLVQEEDMLASPSLGRKILFNWSCGPIPQTNCLRIQNPGSVRRQNSYNATTGAGTENTVQTGWLTSPQTTVNLPRNTKLISPSGPPYAASEIVSYAETIIGRSSLQFAWAWAVGTATVQPGITPEIGDTIVDSITLSIFVVEAVSGQVVTVRRLNNIAAVGGVVSFIEAIPTNDGYWSYLKTKFFG